MKIAIFGLGVVGGALDNWLSRSGKHHVVRRDPRLKLHDSIADAELAFVCVPTPSLMATSSWAPGEPLDLTHLDVVLAQIAAESPPGMPVVIRSTLWPGVTERFQARYPDHPFLYVPEFLTEATATRDELFPSRHIVGTTPESSEWGARVLGILAEPEYWSIVPARVAEVIKLATNAFYATKVTFFNQIYDLCRQLNVDYESVREPMEMDLMTASQHMDVHHAGYRGFGGKCLPKDTRALLQTFLHGPADHQGAPWHPCVTHSLIADALSYNASLPESDEPADVVDDKIAIRPIVMAP